MKNETKKETKLYQIDARLDVEISESFFAVSEEDATEQMREYYHNLQIFDEPEDNFVKYLEDDLIGIERIEIIDIEITDELPIDPDWRDDFLGRQESARGSRKVYDLRQSITPSDDGVLTND